MVNWGRHIRQTDQFVKEHKQIYSKFKFSIVALIIYFYSEINTNHMLSEKSLIDMWFFQSCFVHSSPIVEINLFFSKDPFQFLQFGQR